MADEKNKDNGTVNLYAGFEHVAQIPTDEFKDLKDDGHPVYAYPYGNTDRAPKAP